MIGTTRETISRTLTKMKKDELIEVDEEGNMILDIEILLEEINLILIKTADDNVCGFFNLF